MKNIIIGRRLQELFTKDDTRQYGKIGKIGNRGNMFRTTVEPNLSIYLNDQINFTNPFETIIVIEKTEISLQYHDIK